MVSECENQSQGRLDEEREVCVADIQAQEASEEEQTQQTSEQVCTMISSSISSQHIKLQPSI